ncbi:MAG: substrate-binding domain-containing protein [Phycisphaeraceae bacterium]|nr:MAG: substrate-binding domain-containing protein [Phycisphaeraceae bacterium]
MNRRNALAVFALALSAPALAGDHAPPVKSYQFGVVAKSQSNPVFIAARTGAMDAAKDLEKKHGVQIRINWQTPTNEDAQLQAQFIEQLAGLGVDGITVSCSDANVLTSAIDAAVAKGVTVVTFDSDAPRSRRMAYYGVNDEECGRKLMQELAKAMGDKGGKVAVLAGNQNAPNLQLRVKGVRDEIEKLRDKGFTLKDVYYHKETAADAAARVQQVQAADPEIAGWAMVGGWPLFTQNALDGVYDKAKIVAVDALTEQIKYVQAGQVQTLIVQDCYGWGYKTVEMLFNKAHLGEEPRRVINTFELKTVTKDNASEYIDLWKKWLGEGDKKDAPSPSAPKPAGK